MNDGNVETGSECIEKPRNPNSPGGPHSRHFVHSLLPTSVQLPFSSFISR
jgi:hypothetical protein